MTAPTATAAPARPAALPSDRLRWSAAAEHATVLAALAVWIFYVTPRSGGQDRPAEAIGLLALVPALIATRPWRRMTAVTLAVPAVVAVGAAVVLWTTPTGWSYARFAGYPLYGLLLFVLVAAYARTHRRRLLVAAAVAVAGIWQFDEGLVPWWGNGDPNKLMYGTFYWHNQFGIYLAGCALLAFAMAVAGRRLSRAVALAAAVLCTTGVVLSTSRATLALLCLGWLATLPLAVRRPRGLTVWMSLPVATAALVVFLTSPLLFPGMHYRFFLLPGAPGGRGMSTLGPNGGARVLFTKAALASWIHHPLLGTGFGSFLTTSVNRMPLGYTLSPFVHDGYADALTSGGLVYGLPVLATALSALGLFVRTVAPTVGRGGTRVFPSDSGLRFGVGLAGAVLLAHSAVDFDWVYPSLCALLGVLAGLAFALQPSRGDAQPRRNRSGEVVPAFAALLALALPLTLGVAGPLRDRWHYAFVPSATGAAGRVNQMLDAAAGPFPDPVLAARALSAVIAPGPYAAEHLAVPPATARRALTATASLASIDPKLAMRRAVTEVALGERGSGLSLARGLADRYGAHRPYLYGDEAIALATAGELPQARVLVRSALRRFARTPGATADLAYLQQTLTRLDEPNGGA